MLFNQIRIGQRFNLEPEDLDGPPVECDVIDVNMLENGKGLIIVHFNDPLNTSVAGFENKPLHNFMQFIGD
jgi:hypothetical protein